MTSKHKYMSMDVYGLNLQIKIRLDLHNNSHHAAYKKIMQLQ